MSLAQGYVRRLLDETREENSRADTKASIVLAGSGVVLGILLTGLVSGNLTLKGKGDCVLALAWLAGALLVGGVATVGSAVYPRTKGAEPGHARWFAELIQYGDDEDQLAAAVEADQSEPGRRDLHQARVIGRIVARKYRRTQIGMWLLACGFALAGVTALLALH